ncbi:transposase [Enterococcus cecorum]|nr:transposase [Enterococcus cecorum]CAI3442606.1 IS630 family transposase [Enterococcus cecorum]
MNEFLKRLSREFKEDYLILIMDNAVWHKSKTLNIPENIELMFIPPYIPELNPIEQIWKEIREKVFANEVFPTLEHVIDRLCETINNLTNEVVKSICKREWLIG